MKCCFTNETNIFPKIQGKRIFIYGDLAYGKMIVCEKEKSNNVFWFGVRAFSLLVLSAN